MCTHSRVHTYPSTCTTIDVHAHALHTQGQPLPANVRGVYSLEVEVKHGDMEIQLQVPDIGFEALPSREFFLRRVSKYFHTITCECMCFDTLLYACVVNSRGGVYTCSLVCAAKKRRRCASTKTTCTQVVIVLRIFRHSREREKESGRRRERGGRGGGHHALTVCKPQ